MTPFEHGQSVVYKGSDWTVVRMMAGNKYVILEDEFGWTRAKVEDVVGEPDE